MAVGAELEYAAAARAQLHEFMRAPEAAPQPLSEPDGRHAVAGVWRPFGIIVTCHGHWLIPAPGPQDLRPLRP